MPILASEPSVFPSNLLDELPPEASGRQWWAVHTKPRQEKALGRQLLGKEIPFYLPLVDRDHLIRGKRVQSHVPLFAGYVFLYGSDEERVACLATNRTVNILPVADGAGLRHDLTQVQRLIEADAPLTVERRLVPGQRVRIKGGAMQGTEGVVLNRRGKTRLLVAVQFLQQGVSVAIESYLLEPVG